MHTSNKLKGRTDPFLRERLAVSASAVENDAWMRTRDVPEWLAERTQAQQFLVEQIQFSDLTDWSFDPNSGNLHHRTNRFFTVEGLSVTTNDVLGDFPNRSWQQPIIRQPEIGVLGLLAKEFNGVLHFLIQAKMEPGNKPLMQLSPTVQATRSNYSGVHQGGTVRYLDYFTNRTGTKVLFDVLQSEHGAWFYRKFNRNMLVETTIEVEIGEDFCWLTLGQLGQLLRQNHIVNMDTRTILGCIPTNDVGEMAVGTDAEFQSWFTVERSRYEIDARTIGLRDVSGWERDGYSIFRADRRFFRVVAVGVQANNREVTGWDQPLFAPTSTGVAAFVVKVIGGVAHLLVQAKVEAGFSERVELAPTVQCSPASYDGVPPSDLPPFLAMVLNASPERILYDTYHSEEGGRFFHAACRYLFVEADGALQARSGFRWVTPGQLGAFTAHSRYVNVQARTLLSVLQSGTLRLPGSTMSIVPISEDDAVSGAGGGLIT